MPLRPFLLALALAAPNLAHAQAVFDLVDTDGDGQIARAELDAQRLSNFLALDRNGDGVVDRQELMVGPGQGRKGYTAEQTQAVLAAYDHDGDGLITKAEVEEAIERLNIFAGLDINGDGFLDRAEAEGALDTRVRGGVPGAQILEDLAQGKRTTAGFRPVEPVIVLNPFDQARLDAAGGASREADYQSPRTDGWGGSVWADPDRPGAVNIVGNQVAQAPYARNGYVARRVEPLRHGSLDPSLPGAVPPGPQGGIPVYDATASNWREVPLDPQGRPLR